jgi:hypothetical protein
VSPYDSRNHDLMAFVCLLFDIVIGRILTLGVCR